MVTVGELKKRVSQAFSEEQAEVLFELVELIAELVKAKDFAELKQVVKELAEAQKETQKEVTKLDRALQELAEAQKETHKEVTRLNRALQKLAEAQKRTEEELHELIREHKETRKQLGGLSITVGYTLENEAFKALPTLLQKDFGLVVREKLKRKYVSLEDGRYIEVNILGEATRNGIKVVIVGEGKAQLSKNDVNDFIRKKLSKLKGLFPEIFPVMVTHMTSSPDVEEYVREKGIALYYSYDF